eukprot:551538-Rhodomonas_salina.1
MQFRVQRTSHPLSHVWQCNVRCCQHLQCSGRYRLSSICVQYPVLPVARYAMSDIVLSTRYAVSGTNLAHGATRP